MSIFPKGTLVAWQADCYSRLDIETLVLWVHLCVAVLHSGHVHMDTLCGHSCKCRKLLNADDEEQDEPAKSQSF